MNHKQQTLLGDEESPQELPPQLLPAGTPNSGKRGGTPSPLLEEMFVGWTCRQEEQVPSSC